MKSLIIGNGEVGKSLFNVLSPFYETSLIGKHNYPLGFEHAEILHICFPYGEDFASEVKRYQELHQPRYTLIHSTVPPGTSRACGAYHSPVIGLHPNLESGIRTFIKFLSGENSDEVAQYFRRAGLKLYLFDKQETSELMKILDTTFYGLCVEYVKDVKRLCQQYEVPFEAWTLWTDNYNKGYQTLGHREFTRPNLIPMLGRIGGHCVLPNCDMIDSRFTKMIKQANEQND